MDTFTIDLTKFINGSREKAARIIRKIGIASYGEITMRTPVDTGRARANWRPSIGEVDYTVTNETQLDGVRAVVAFKNAEPGDTLYIANSLPYVEGLENGASVKQAPTGMVDVSLANIKSKIESGEFKL